jgi:rhamnosyltransferase
MTVSAPNCNNTIGVMVTYHPEPSVISRLSALARQFHRVLVIDNSSSVAIVESLRSLTALEPRIELVENRENLGIATALNQGCSHALEQGAEWIVTFDQDSIPIGNLLACVSVEWDADPQRERVGLVGVNYRNSIGMLLLPEGSGMAEARTVITSGSLLNLAAWRKTGPFRDEYFIDEVDHEYALRLRKNGWHVKVTRAVLMDHALGAMRRHEILGWRPTPSHHPARRRYYMMRNRIFLARDYVRFDPEFIWGRALASVYEFVTVLLFESNKLAKFLAMSRGLFDGLRGRTGGVV